MSPSADISQAPEVLLDRLLDAVEALEQRALRWGYTDASVSRDDLLRLADPIAGTRIAAEELVVELLDRALLLELPTSGRYRSRFAEGVRLLTSLRQLFPRHSSWLAAHTLVSDFRVDRRARRYPKRELKGDDVLSELAARLKWSDRQKAAAGALAGGMKLSGFQARAFEAVSGGAGTDRAVVISAGTGSGKTLAYYLPAYVSVADLIKPGEFWTKAISIYPRNELLKDQFTEAYRLARLVASILPRRLRLGTFFGPTPFQADREAVKDWEAINLSSAGQGFACPFLRCPECGGRMLWLAGDLTQRRERLVCEHSVSTRPSCSVQTERGELALTRRSAQSDPPDFLFTTVEMLNQRMSDGWSRHLFGLGAQRKPALLLLDEAHTYEGISGAQTALVLRRWRHALESPVLRVGLSATLTEAQRFFGQVAGVPEHLVTEVSPQADEFESDAAEYQLILRGDPVSPTSLLSTSIQTSFLLARLLDTDQSRSHGRFGSRLFVFTDDLDATNRLYDDLRDAERYANPPRPLASLRVRSDDQARLAAGQDWRALETIGWNLTQSVTVSRTSSQDVGVDYGSQIVVATASLEVGFNDNRVGAVLQHKAPHHVSSFLQRKGRGGRTREMRPWTITVLSDYGRDRFAYHAYETLFSPVVPAQHLPIDNLYVMRIQATFSTIEWLALQHPGAKGWWWWAFNGPAGSTNDLKEQQAKAIETIVQLIDGNARLLASLQKHLRDALSLSPETVESILFEPPRSLLLEFLPTLLRRLQTDWKLASPVGDSRLDLVQEGGPPRPAPEFLPPNLFTDLNLPEVSISGPRIDEGASMMVEQALRHLAPGRITRRFASRSSGLHHWIPVPLDLGDQPHRMPIDRYATDYRIVTEAPVEVDMSVQQVPVYRPWQVRLSEAATTQSPINVQRQSGGMLVLPSSNAYLDWQSQLIPLGDPSVYRTDFDRTWRQILPAIEFHTHSRSTPLTARRFALSATADIRARPLQGTTQRFVVHTKFADPSVPAKPAAIGFEAEVDALCLRLKLPATPHLADLAEASPELPTWRTAHMRHLIQSDLELSRRSNVFLSDWLFEVYLAALIELAVDADSDLAAANEILPSAVERFEFVLEAIFQTVVDDNNGSADDLRTELRDLLHDGDVVRVLAAAAHGLWAPDDADWGGWLRNSLHETLAQGAVLASIALAPQQVAEDSLLVDLERGIPEESLPDGDAEAWLSETAIGGAGAVEALAGAYATNPRDFLRALEAAFAPGDYELTSERLRQVLRLTQSDAEVRRAIHSTRNATGPTEREEALRTLFAMLATRGIFVDHLLSVALNQRLLREGTDESSDELLSDLFSYWESLQARVGITIDLRVFAYLAVRSPEYGPRIGDMIERASGKRGEGGEAAGIVAGLLWTPPAELRRSALKQWSPYREIGFTDPALVRDLLLTEKITAVVLGEDDWESRVSDALRQNGKVDLLAPSQQSPGLKQSLTQLIAKPVDTGFLQFYPSIDGVHYRDGAVATTLVLRTLA